MHQCCKTCCISVARLDASVLQDLAKKQSLRLEKVLRLILLLYMLLTGELACSEFRPNQICNKPCLYQGNTATANEMEAVACAHKRPCSMFEGSVALCTCVRQHAAEGPCLMKMPHEGCCSCPNDKVTQSCMLAQTYDGSQISSMLIISFLCIMS